MATSEREPTTPATWPGPCAGTVCVVGVNPAIDRLQIVDRFEAGQVNRANEVVSSAGGKSFIVARTLRRRGAPVALYGFLGGPAAKLAADECDELGIEDRHTRIAGDTRITPVVIDQATGRTTVINEPGPVISQQEREQFNARLEADLPGYTLVVCTGSLPRGISDDLYADLAQRAAAVGALACIDASGTALKLALAAEPWLIKCNDAELSDANAISGGASEETLLEAMAQQIARGIAIMIVTRGSAPTIVATADGAWRVSVPRIEVVNATGSGDTFFGCLIAAIAAGSSLADALRDATAGGVINAGQMKAGLQESATLEPYRSSVRFERIDEADIG